ncbi:MAG: tetratricopeptide repeat protein, partial [Lachnospiraceae bacterium]|nr:tetratricopeptide repeat protein [Lachnospiraceae bacterium]
GTEHPSTATTYNNMALVYQAQGDYEKALEYYKRAYSIRLSRFGENHPYTKGTKRGIEVVESLMK